MIEWGKPEQKDPKILVCRSLPGVSSRPCRYQQRPCNLDCFHSGRGDAYFFQQAGWIRHAGQTPKIGDLSMAPDFVIQLFQANNDYMSTTFPTLFSADFL
jgi:hypothetical protein